jgi:hypothetical protein
LAIDEYGGSNKIKGEYKNIPKPSKNLTIGVGNPTPLNKKIKTDINPINHITLGGYNRFIFIFSEKLFNEEEDEFNREFVKDKEITSTSEKINL